MKTNKFESIIYPNVHVASWPPQDIYSKPATKPNIIYTLTISYPLDNPKTYQIKSGKNGITFETLIEKICALYSEVYALPTLYGIWGHSINDLYIECISVNHKKKTIILGMGS